MINHPNRSKRAVGGGLRTPTSMRFGSAKAPRRFRTKEGESYAAARARYRTKWAEYRDAQIMAECAYQASFSSTPRRRVHFFRAFYGVQGEFIIAATREA